MVIFLLKRKLSSVKSILPPLKFHEKLHLRIKVAIKFIQRYVDRLWYGPAIGFLAGLDSLIVIIPSDGILISSSMLTPKRWFWLALCTAFGSTLGAVVLAILVRHHGLPWILNVYPDLMQSKSWTMSLGFFEDYGLLLVFAVGMTPLMQQPAVILASLAQTPLAKLGFVMLGGRLVKYLVMAYLGSHAPRLLKRFKFLSTAEHLDDAGIKLE